ncbi:pyridoxal 5'-phosphate synthase glutaminase subunit PdxT [uncultured Treponema sp.]|uniref:pyridoxal 5'-phosphate synthase glutaminase subunit PdxT n=1 Tax=uncultured Treponema sp. TaxID=162155 RepID=UPI0015BE6C41|nr:pyridoxal 5'-phosphate synthase glutaminase subunit PdxT [uncultured Treponema sp.]
MKAAVLALQGAFVEHEKKLSSLGVSCLELRKKSDLEQSFDLLVLPGGESTVQGKLLRELDMFDTLKARIEGGIKVLATCAGMILLAEKIENDERQHFAVMPVTVKRNAYGRQLGSFYTEESFTPVGKIPMTFIRAPYIAAAGKNVEILARVNERITAARYKNQLALSFHPELNEDLRLYEWWLNEKPL